MNIKIIRQCCYKSKKNVTQGMKWRQNMMKKNGET